MTAPLRLTTEDRRVAWHEAGHAVVGLVLGREPGPISITETEHYAGITFTHPQDVPADDVERSGGVPLPLMPAPVRRWFEVSACVSMAGALAEELRWLSEPKTRLSRRPNQPWREERPVIAPAPMSARDEAVIAEAQRPPASDAENTWEAATAFAGLASPLAVVAAFVSYLEAVTRALLHDHRSDVQRLAEALLQHRTLSAEAVRDIIEGASE